MEKVVRLTPEQRADLVAYLDGELPEEESRAIDQTLTVSDVARHEVEALTSTWQMLDLLPQETASPEFTARTLDTIQLSTESPAAKWAPRLNLLLISLGWLLWIAAAGIIGFTIAHRLIGSPSDSLVRDLPVLENLDLYQDVGSVEYLKALEERRALRTAPPR